MKRAERAKGEQDHQRVGQLLQKITGLSIISFSFNSSVFQEWTGDHMYIKTGVNRRITH